MDQKRFVFYFPPHQDDELCNFGAAILRDLDAGHEVFSVLCTDGGASSARTCIGNGETCRLHGGTHDYRLTREEFSAARDREYHACCAAMGIRQENIRISPLRGRDAELTQAQAERIILDAIAGFPPDRIAVKAFVPITACRQNPDHAAVARAAQALFDAGAFGGLTQFYEAIYLDAADGEPYSLEKLTLNESQRERFIAASRCYGLWAPERGFFAVGYHSVKDEFDLLAADPAGYVCKF